ncbi:MAG: helix-turn-helix domain-containing protein, partial [Nitrococcus sp.]|nr:helix-turn-helix domain-containing protein [Nitrococcus sp.]
AVLGNLRLGKHVGVAQVTPAALKAAPHASVSQVAYAVGFNDLSYFGRMFRQLVGEPATCYQQRLGQNPALRQTAAKSWRRRSPDRRARRLYRAQA